MSFAPLSAHIANEVKRIISWSAPAGPASLCLVLDPSLSPSISRLLDVSTLQSLKVKEIFELSGVDPLRTECEHVLYIIRPEEEMIGRLAFQTLKLNSVKAVADSDLKAPVFVACVPNMTSICARQLENFGLYDRLQVTSLPAMAINCLDEDLATFHDGVTFQRAFIESDPHVVQSVVNNLLEIQRVYGEFGEISGRGKIASTVCELLNRRQQALNASPELSFNGPRISRVICIDRTNDLITPMLIGFTYEGVIDEVIGIEMGYCNISSEVIKSTKEGAGSSDTLNKTDSENMRCPLFNTDQNYARIRDKSFPYVLLHMSTLVKHVSKKLNEHTEAKEIHQMKGFVKSLPNYLSELDSVSTHTNLLMHLTTFTNSPSFLQLLRTEDALLNKSDLGEVLDTIEYSIVQQEPWQKPIRLLCLWSQIYGGLNDDDYTGCCRKLVNSYGAALMLPLLHRLARSGLFYRKGDLPSKINWKLLKRDLNLVAEAVKPSDQESPTDYHFVHGYCAYAPISIRLLEKRIRDKSWTSVNSITNKDEVCFNKKQQMDAPGATLVVFIGGITRSEVAALRFLSSQQPDNPYLICGNLITGGSLLQSMKMLSPAH